MRRLQTARNAGWFVGIVATWLVAAGIPTHAKEGELQWRFLKNESQLDLYIADTDLGTDNVGSPSFKCEKGDTNITIRGVMDAKLRRAYADTIVREKYPRAEFASDKEGDSHFLEPVFSEMHGWMYMLPMSVGSEALARFKKTGVLNFKFNGAAISQGEKAGLDKIGAFFETCQLVMC